MENNLRREALKSKFKKENDADDKIEHNKAQNKQIGRRKDQNNMFVMD
jgi:hypothetical protein